MIFPGLGGGDQKVVFVCSFWTNLKPKTPHHHAKKKNKTRAFTIFFWKTRDKGTHHTSGMGIN